MRRWTKRLVRHAFEFGDLPSDKPADPFTAVIRCTCADLADSKAISKWARALRYVAHCKVHTSQLKTFMMEAGRVSMRVLISMQNILDERRDENSGSRHAVRRGRR
jgi:hypothetical protein